MSTSELEKLREKMRAANRLWVTRVMRGAKQAEADACWRAYEAARDAYWAARDGAA